MSTLITGDLHESDRPRDEYRWRFLEKTLPALIKKHQVDRVVIAGDLTEQKDEHRSALVNRLVDAVEAIAQDASVIALKGNHDYLAEDVPFFRFLRHLDNVRWINEPTRLNLRGLGACWFLPHDPDPVKAWDSGYFADATDWYFCHQTFAGSKSESGREMTGPPHSMFPRGARVISGDVHVPQKVGPVTYVGAPTTIDFGDAFQPRVLIIDRDKVHSVPVPGPQKRLAGASATRSGKIVWATDGIQSGDVVKLRINLDRSDVSRAQARKEAQEWAAQKGVHLHGIEVISSTAKPEKVAEKKPQVSDAELVRAYAKKMSKGKATVAVGLKLMEETT